MTAMSKIVIISCSLRTNSLSLKMAKESAAHLPNAQFIDLKELNLPFCDAGAAYGHPDSQKINQRIQEAEGIILASPIYNYDLNAAAKNLIELTGQSWKNKVVGFICAAGGFGSFMAPMQLASSLMLDFRCTIIPRYVYATGKQFEDGEISDAELKERIEEFSQTMAFYTKQLQGGPND